MGHMKDLDRRIRQGGDDAIAAVAELWESREKILFDITDAFTKARWIPVSKRLPEDGEQVIVWMPDCPHHPCGMDMGSCMTMLVSTWWPTDRPFEPNGVTHWMPLPEPPKS